MLQTPSTHHNHSSLHAFSSAADTHARRGRADQSGQYSSPSSPLPCDKAAPGRPAGRKTRMGGRKTHMGAILQWRTALCQGQTSVTPPNHLALACLPVMFPTSRLPPATGVSWFSVHLPKVALLCLICSLRQDVGCSRRALPLRSSTSRSTAAGQTSWGGVLPLPSGILGARHYTVPSWSHVGQDAHLPKDSWHAWHAHMGKYRRPVEL